MKISRTVAYAVQATLQLSQADPPQTPVPCSRIAAEGGMPERFLLQVLRNLVTHGILQSTRGIEGGYSLGRKPDEISLLDVIEAIDGPLSASVPTGQAFPPAAHAKLDTALNLVAADARRQLKAIKFSHLARPSSAK